MGFGPFFFYGTLCDSDVRAAVMGRTAALRLRVTPARVHGFRAVYAAGKRYPVLVVARGAEARGVLAEGLDARAFARLCAFEAGYVLAPITVETEDGQRAALVFRARKHLRPSGRPFELVAWQSRHKPDYLKNRARVG